MTQITPRLSVSGPDSNGICELFVRDFGDTFAGDESVYLSRTEADALIAALARPVTGHPMQPIERDGHGVIRFRRNAIVRYLIDFGQSHKCGLNELARMPFSDDDWTQLAQLMGYSVSGAGDLSYFNADILTAADAIADKLLTAAPPSTDPATGAR